eukprot:875983-Karenia_brevis.AAC.1
MQILPTHPWWATLTKIPDMQNGSIADDFPLIDAPPPTPFRFDGQLDVDYPRALGIDNRFKQQEPDLFSWLCECVTYNARTAVRWLDGASRPPKLPSLPDFVSHDQQSCIRVFTDGSCSHPKYPELALSSAGVFWPHRHDDLTSLEQEYTECRKINDGYELQVPVDTYPGDSFRAELAGLITTLYSPFVIHVSLDNLGV